MGSSSSVFERVAQLTLGVGLCVLAMQLAARMAGAEPPADEVAVGRPADPAPVVTYALVAKLDAERHHVRGSGTVTWRNASTKPQKEIYLHLYLNAFSHDDTVFMRNRKHGFRGGGAPATWGGIDVERIYAPELGIDLWASAVQHTPGDEDDATDIRLELPRAVAPGESLSLELDWVSRLPSVTHRTGFARSFHMVAQWFPKIARLEPDGTWAHFPFHRLSEFYADFATYDVTIDMPTGHVVGASGTRLQRTEDGERTRVRYRIERAHDFAFTAYDGFAERSATSADGVEIRCLYPEGLEAIADLEIAEASAGLEALGAAYGPYPYRTLTIVHPPRWASNAGGMEYPTLITTGGHWLGPRVGVGAVHAVTVHELAHQWFYGLVATNEFRWPFLDEGLTTFASTHALEARYPGRSAFAGLGFEISLWAISRAGAARSYDRGPASLRADQFESGSDYGGLVYSKTATAVETLRRVYGGEAMGAALARYAREGRFAHPTPADLLGAVRAEVGEEAADNLRLALLEGAWVDYRVADFDDAGGIVAVRQGRLAFDVPVLLRHDDGTEKKLMWPATERRLELPATGVAAVIIDPELTVLLDHDLTNNARARGRSPLAPRVLGQAAWIANALSLVVAP